MKFLYLPAVLHTSKLPHNQSLHTDVSFVAACVFNRSLCLRIDAVVQSNPVRYFKFYGFFVALYCCLARCRSSSVSMPMPDDERAFSTSILTP